MGTTVKTSGTLPYDIKNAKSIFEYSKGLLGKTLRDYVWEGYESKKGKGGLGQMVDINHLYATNARQRIPRTPLLCTSRSYSSWLNRRTDFSRSRILANEWNEECLLSSECTLVRCQGHSSVHGASAPS